MKSHHEVLNVREQSRREQVDEETHHQNSPVQHGTVPSLANRIRVVESEQPLDEGAGSEGRGRGQEQPRQHGEPARDPTTRSPGSRRAQLGHEMVLSSGCWVPACPGYQRRSRSERDVKGSLA